MSKRHSISIVKKIIAACFALALLALSAGEARTQRQVTNPKQLPFQAGEELIYKAELSKGLLRDVDVAEFHFTVNEEKITPAASRDDPVAVYHFSGDVFSNGFFVR